MFSLTIKGLKFFSWICQGRNAKFPRPLSTPLVQPLLYLGGGTPTLPRPLNTPLVQPLLYLDDAALQGLREPEPQKLIRALA